MISFLVIFLIGMHVHPTGNFEHLQNQVGFNVCHSFQAIFKILEMELVRILGLINESCGCLPFKRKISEIPVRL